MYTHATEAGWISRSHRAIAPFRLSRPDSPEEAVEALSEAADAQFIAGGVDLVRRMRGGDRPGTLVDISGLVDLKGIEDRGDTIRIGGLATHWDVERDALLAARLPAFQQAWTTIGNVRIRMTGTVGGNLMAGERGYDCRVLLGVAGATVVYLTRDGELALPAAMSHLEAPEGALLAAVDVPVSGATRLAFDRSLKPVVSVAAAFDGERVNVGAGCAFDTPFFWSGSPEAVSTGLADTLPEPLDNPMGSAAYRRRMIVALAQRLHGSLRDGDAA